MVKIRALGHNDQNSNSSSSLSWASILTSQSLSFVICKVEVIKPALQGWCENWRWCQLVGYLTQRWQKINKWYWFQWWWFLTLLWGLRKWNAQVMWPHSLSEKKNNACVIYYRGQCGLFPRHSIGEVGWREVQGGTNPWRLSPSELAGTFRKCSVRNGRSGLFASQGWQWRQ